MTCDTMAIFSCPGSSALKEPIPEFFRCFNCGAEVEIWTHEFSRKCENCGNEVSKEYIPTCVEWCEMARECVGDALYERFMKKIAEREQEEKQEQTKQQQQKQQQ